MKIIVLCEEIIDNFGNVTGIEILDEPLVDNSEQMSLYDKYLNTGKKMKMIQVDLDTLPISKESITNISRLIQDAVHLEYSEMLNN
jgi:hypothetical protein